MNALSLACRPSAECIEHAVALGVEPTCTVLLVRVALQHPEQGKWCVEIISRWPFTTQELQGVNQVMHVHDPAHSIGRLPSSRCAQPQQTLRHRTSVIEIGPKRRRGFSTTAKHLQPPGCGSIVLRMDQRLKFAHSGRFDMPHVLSRTVWLYCAECQYLIMAFGSSRPSSRNEESLGPGVDTLLVDAVAEADRATESRPEDTKGKCHG